MLLAILMERHRGFWLPIAHAKVEEAQLGNLPESSGLVIYDEDSFRQIPDVPKGQTFAEYVPDIERISKTYHYDTELRGWSPIPDDVDHGLEVTYLSERRIQFRYRTFEGEHAEFSVGIAWCMPSGATPLVRHSGDDIIVRTPHGAQMVYAVLEGDTAGTLYQVESWYPPAEIVEEDHAAVR